MQQLTGRAAAVTGAGGGIGRALALRLAAEGMRLALADIDADALAETGALVAGTGAEVVTRVTDVGDEESVAAFADLAFAELGAVHLLCNNAGVYMGGRVWTRPAADFEWTLRVNLWGILHGVRAFVPRMIEQDTEGHIVNTCSVAGLFVGPGAAPYTVSKWAAFAATLTLAQELALEGAKLGVSALCPGGVTTRIHQSERVRPAALATEPGEDSAFMNEMIAATVANGIPPREVADRVVDAVRAGRFLVLTHPAYEPGLAEQAEALAAGRLPRMPDFEWTR
ncbi:NADP-dependent 3-hydroxy acid dehydrogenase YdfG [Thermomonospora echinospora]|uniref:NADP-dependent 3-hydroxy acid dehydrogenase YdfG n=1 Tax=Thermomonospora echinospora TaxID=1992 RepID=A0A1H5T279_9ACTN|nr:SDR family NAD(P)-dependent oxidoreductase [Thermomonospora echinospora]SEF56875.1 NADP-dependent 3-hydroxy acid dehydrogenase YdfG [Thermomonospora echinospora]